MQMRVGGAQSGDSRELLDMSFRGTSKHRGALVHPDPGERIRAFAPQYIDLAGSFHVRYVAEFVWRVISRPLRNYDRVPGDPDRGSKPTTGAVA